MANDWLNALVNGVTGPLQQTAGLIASPYTNASANLQQVSALPGAVQKGLAASGNLAGAAQPQAQTPAPAPAQAAAAPAQTPAAPAQAPRIAPAATPALALKDVPQQPDMRAQHEADAKALMGAGYSLVATPDGGFAPVRGMTPAATAASINAAGPVHPAAAALNAGIGGPPAADAPHYSLFQLSQMAHIQAEAAQAAAAAAAPQRLLTNMALAQHAARLAAPAGTVYTPPTADTALHNALQEILLRQTQALLPQAPSVGGMP